MQKRKYTKGIHLNFGPQSITASQQHVKASAKPLRSRNRDQDTLPITQKSKPIESTYGTPSTQPETKRNDPIIEICDEIVLRNGIIIKGVIREVGRHTIHYEPCQNSEHNPQRLEIAEISLIRYATGLVESFPEKPAQANTVPPDTSLSLTSEDVTKRSRLISGLSWFGILSLPLYWAFWWNSFQIALVLLSVAAIASAVIAPVLLFTLCKNLPTQSTVSARRHYITAIISISLLGLASITALATLSRLWVIVPIVGISVLYIFLVVSSIQALKKSRILEDHSEGAPEKEDRDNSKTAVLILLIIVTLLIWL